MNVAAQYKSLLKKVAEKNSAAQVRTVYEHCMTKKSSLGESLLWASAGALPAYLYGSSIGKQKEQEKHKNYALAGAAAGFLAPKLLGAIIDPSSAIPSISGFDASDIQNLQLESLDKEDYNV